MVHDAILDYLKLEMLTNTNNSANTASQEDPNKPEKSQLTSQLSIPVINDSISSDNILKTLFVQKL